MKIKMSMKRIDVNVEDVRVFQHLVLLFDRQDFYIDLLVIKEKARIGKIKLDLKDDIIGQYNGIPTPLYNEIEELRKKYRYPRKLSIAIIAALILWKVSENDIIDYNPSASPRTKLVRQYSHPILAQPIERKTIKRDREWYWLNREGIGYRRLEKKYKFKHSIQTIASAIRSYEEKLLIKL